MNNGNIIQYPAEILMPLPLLGAPNPIYTPGGLPEAYPTMEAIDNSSVIINPTDYWQNGVKYRAHIFLSSGRLLVFKPGWVDYLVVAGGGSGGSINSVAGGAGLEGGGGGGAGGLLTGYIPVPIGIHSVIVGSGASANPVGSDRTPGTRGNNSIFLSVISYGGGGGGSAFLNATFGQSGGSGGGGGRGQAGIAFDVGGKEVGGQGKRGGNGNGGVSTNTRQGGGGGGAGNRGEDAIGGVRGGNGGIGIQSNLSGTNLYYAGGGGGGGGSTAVGAGGAGGGGAAGTNATANTGGGGGGGHPTDATTRAGGAGGSGIIIVRYRIF